MAVRAKFKVYLIERHTGEHEMQTIRMHPVTSGSEENTRFWQATPGGELTLNCLNLEAAGKFELGKEYYIDFTEA